MGRGRQRAKQAKVARELKYFSPDTDYAALQRELGAGGSSASDVEVVVDDDDDGSELDDSDDDYGWTAERR